jgi:hypothetical protein
MKNLLKYSYETLGQEVSRHIADSCLSGELGPSKEITFNL